MRLSRCQTRYPPHALLAICSLGFMSIVASIPNLPGPSAEGDRNWLRYIDLPSTRGHSPHESTSVDSSNRTVPRSARGAPRRVDWRLENTTGEKPSARGGGKWVPVGKQLVLFGGFRECFDKTKCDHTYFDDLYMFDVATKRWEKKKPVSKAGALPGKRSFPGATTYKKKSTALFFGGAQYNATTTSVRVYDDLWEYDPGTDTFAQRTYANQGPGARLGAEIVIEGDTLYLFGGYDNRFKAHNDLWSFDLLKNTWSQLKKDDDPRSPSKRYIFRFELDDRNKEVYIFGGNYRETKTIQRNDTWKYNIPTNTFAEVVSEQATNITGRTHGAGALHDDLLVIALGDIPNGGCFTNQDSEHQNPTQEVWCLKLWGRRPASLWRPVNIGSGPPPLKRLFYARVGDRLYVTHGFNYECDKPDAEGALYNLNTYSLPLNRVRY